jgi:hypothetical protein
MDAEDSEDKRKCTLTVNEPYSFGIFLKLSGELLLRCESSDQSAGGKAKKEEHDK